MLNENEDGLENLMSNQRRFVRANFNLMVAKFNLECLEKIRYDKDDVSNMIESYSIFTAFVVSYGKLYVSGSGEETSLLDPSVFGSDSQARTAHDLIMSFRQKICAHDDQHQAIDAYVEKEETEKEVRIIHRLKLEIPFNELDNFLHAIKISQGGISKRVEKNCRKYENNSKKKIILGSVNR